MCGPSSGWSKTSLIILVIAIAIHIAGWGTTSWMVYSTTDKSVSTDIGLWQMKDCKSGTCTESTVTSTYETDAFNVVRAMETITFCLVVLSIILLFIYTCAYMDKRQTFAAVIMFILYIAGSVSFIGMIIFITNLPDLFEVSWSMGLTVIAMTLILIAATLMIPDAFEADDNDNAMVDYEDDYFGRRNVITPISLRVKDDLTHRGITPIAYIGGGGRGVGRW